MRNFILGLAVALLVEGAAIYGFAKLGYVDMRAELEPSQLESSLAATAVDASTRRHAKEANPAAPTEEILLQGMKIYRDNCAGCHGDPANVESKFGLSFFRGRRSMKEPTDMSGAEAYYIVKHGVRWTAMPAWQNTMTPGELAKAATFVTHMSKLPPAVEQQWKAQSRTQ